MKKINFSKLNGQGNDFILIDGIKDDIKLDQRKVSSLCDRHFGIGADGLIVVLGSQEADFKMAYYNADGSVAEMCGNGIRCMARFLHDKSICLKEKMDIETLAGIKKVYLRTGEDGVQRIKVNMGKPDFVPSSIPVNIKGLDEVFNYRLEAEGKVFMVNLVSMGNPHCVILAEDELDCVDLKKWGFLLENHHLFPQKANIEFIRISGSDLIEMRVWERGVGETLACGTGACASAVAAIKLGKVDGRKVRVKVPGGTLDILWDNAGWVYLEGTVSYVFDGEYIDE